MPSSRFFRMLLGGYFRRIPPAPQRPNPAAWSDLDLTVAWLGHSTVLINFAGFTILTDPVLYARVGLGWGPFILGPKRHVAPALRVAELPKIDLVLLSHAHMDHFDQRTLSHFDEETPIVTACRTSDLLRRPATELSWGERAQVGGVEIEAFEVRHWGARMRTDDFRGYNGYILKRAGRKILFAGDTAHTPLFRRLREKGPFDLAMFPIGAYDPWIGAHCTPEQAVAMADDAGARRVLPLHHQTFQLSFEPMDDPVRRFRLAMADRPEQCIALPVGGTSRVPPGDVGLRRH